MKKTKAPSKGIPDKVLRNIKVVHETPDQITKLVKEMDAIKALGRVRTDEGLKPVITGIINRTIKTPKGVPVFRVGAKKPTGKTTGRAYRCRLDGCAGYRIVVRWKDGHFTHPCSKGMRLSLKGWRIL